MFGSIPVRHTNLELSQSQLLSRHDWLSIAKAKDRFVPRLQPIATGGGLRRDGYVELPRRVAHQESRQTWRRPPDWQDGLRRVRQ